MTIRDGVVLKYLDFRKNTKHIFNFKVQYRRNRKLHLFYITPRHCKIVCSLPQSSGFDALYLVSFLKNSSSTLDPFHRPPPSFLFRSGSV